MLVGYSPAIYGHHIILHSMVTTDNIGMCRVASHTFILTIRE